MIRLYTIAILLLVFAGSEVYGQYNIDCPEKLYTDMPDLEKIEIVTSLNRLLEGIANKNIPNDLLDSEDIDFNTNYFKSLEWMIEYDAKEISLRSQILNLYKITGCDSYNITLAYSKSGNDSILPVIQSIYTLIAKKKEDKFVFVSPLKYRTRSWKVKSIDEMTFYYPDTLNMKRASAFVAKSKMIASKFSLPVKEFKVYVTNNYQETLNVLGVDYRYANNGVVNDGYMTYPYTLFAIRGNEDFSHDALHLYAHSIRTIRNITAEEGLAYTWGDAYYTNVEGYIPNQHDLMVELRQYIKDNPDQTLLNIFDRNPRFFSYSELISSKSAISGAICDEIERVKGVSGIIELLNCGKGDDNYFACIEKLIGINRENFNKKVMPLIMGQ